MTSLISPFCTFLGFCIAVGINKSVEALILRDGDRISEVYKSYDQS